VSGAITYNNGGSHYSVTTGPMLSIPGAGVVYGQVFKHDGTTVAEGTIVYVKIRDNNGSGSSGDSQTFSCLISADGYWNMNPNSLRIPALSGYFSWTSGDQLVISAEGAGDGTASRTVDVAATPPFDMTLN